MSRIRQAVDALLEAVAALESRNDDLLAENLGLKSELRALKAGIKHEPPHQVLGVSPGANEAEIRAAYRTAVRHLHPDSGAQDSEAFHRVTAARDLLLARYS